MNNYSSMAQPTNARPQKENRLAPFCKAMWGELSFHKHDFWQFLAVVAGGSVFFSLVMFAIATFFGDTSGEMWTFVGIAPLVIGVLTLILSTGSLFCIYYPIAVKMSQPRKSTLARLVFLALCYEAVIYVFSLGVFVVTASIGTDFSTALEFLSHVPWWAVALLVILPISLPMLWCGVNLRFGRTASMILYFAMLSPFYLATPIIEWVERLELTFEVYTAYFWALPILGCVFACLPFVLGVLLLRRISIKN